MATVDSQLPVYIYVDSPNLWIAAIGIGNDPRIRIEIYKLVEVVAAGRRFKGFWYRSNTSLPPAFEQKVTNLGFEVREKRTVESTGTCNIYDDITEMARTREEERSTFVIMTGDADVVPAIEEALEHKWKVEVVMWEHATSDKLKELDEAGRIELKYLDENVTFINRTFKWRNSVVLKVDKNHFDQWHFPTWYPNNDWYEEVKRIAQCEFEYAWADFEDSTEIFGLILYFNEEGFNLEEFMRKLNENLGDLHIIEVQKYQIYTQSIREKRVNGRSENVLYLQETTQVRTINTRPDNAVEENGSTVNGRADDAVEDNQENGGTVNSQADDAVEENGGTVNSQADDTFEDEGWTTVRRKRSRKSQVDSSTSSAKRSNTNT